MLISQHGCVRVRHQIFGVLFVQVIRQEYQTLHDILVIVHFLVDSSPVNIKKKVEDPNFHHSKFSTLIDLRWIRRKLPIGCKAF